MPLSSDRLGLPDLSVLDRSLARRELDLASELFHRIDRVLPPNQELLSVPPTCAAREAIALMHRSGYSQLPVVHGTRVLGVFSYRSFSEEAASKTLEEWNHQRCSPGDLPVDEFLEEFKFARVRDEMNSVFDAMDIDNGILVGTDENLLGILTPMDFLRYLYKVACPFVMVSEIELALRALIRECLTVEQIAAAVLRAHLPLHGESCEAPTTLEAMTFDHYRAVIAHSESWPIFEPIFGGMRSRTDAKLREIRDIRNAVFHFKREVSDEDKRTLSNHRGWLLSKISRPRVVLRTESAK